jgi:NADH:ubiquinone oxidoreductase subunit F (NADH-binding)/(2Fe-2S) ferredoxin/NAD-dependent dihydropyrimidine dehydrogenase PreA subunit
MISGNGKPFGSPEALLERAEAIRTERKNLKQDIRVCAGPGCIALGAKEIHAKLRSEIKSHKKELKEAGLKLDVTLSEKCTGCHGMCEAGPIVTLEPEGTFYTGVKPNDAKKIVEKTLLGDQLVDKLLYRMGHHRGGGKAEHYTDVPFYSLQVRVALRNVGVVDPTNFDDFLAEGGFKAFAQALTEMTPEEVIDQVEESGLRGRGGAGFSTGRKWRSALRVKEDRVWLICNGDEGDPGAFMDRAIMEGDPYSVLEGMMIGAYALGATDAWIYVRHEYPLAVEHLQMAIDKLQTAGLLGDNILGTGMKLNVRISRGGGAFVCGESSALMRSLEGKVGEPRAKYVRSVEKGLHDEPTVLNNVETYTCVPAIIDKGASWFASMGRDKSKGTKAFSLVGKVKHTGLIEVPMGRTLREIIFDIGGGIIDDRPFKAVQTGGPSGGCLPIDKLDLPVDFESLAQAGAMMGSGGMIVMDDHTCMVDVAKYFINFLIGESCGKCVPCREGLRQVYDLLDKITTGRGEDGDLEKIEKLCHTMEVASLCALGKSAPFPVTSTIEYFREEYEEHIHSKVCRAGVCPSLIKYEINEDCTGCEVCRKHCPTEAITGLKKKLHVIDPEACISCGICMSVCKFDSVDIVSGGKIVSRDEVA